MNRIIRISLASVGAAVVITGGGLGVAYATTPAAVPAQTSSTGDNDQVATLNQAADDLLAKIATLEKQLTSTPAATPSGSPLTKQEVEVPASSDASPATQVTTTTVQAPAAAPAGATKSDESDSKSGNDSDD